MALRRRPMIDSFDNNPDIPRGSVNPTPVLGGTDNTAEPGLFKPPGGDAQYGETPREREGTKFNAPPLGAPGAGGDQPNSGSSPISSVPRRPTEPTPQAGSQFTPATGSMGVIPFSPMSSTATVGSMGSPSLRGLHGSLGGLKGGGLGVPLDPQTNESGNSIEGLLKILSQLMGR